MKNRGCIIERGSTYLIKVGIGKDPATGKYRYAYETAKTSTEAKKRRTEILSQLDKGTYMQPGKLTVSEFLEKFLADYAKVNLTPKSYERYDSISRKRLIPAFGNMELTKLRPEHLQKHYSAMLQSGLAPRTVRYHHTILHKALATALKWGLVSRNAADGVDIPRAQQKEMQTWNEDELTRFLEAAKGTQYYALFYTALFTGMRRSELLALRWQDIDFTFGQISISRGLHQIGTKIIYTQPKTKKSRRLIAMPPSLFLVLEAYRKAREIEYKMLDRKLEDSDLVFSSLGKPWRPNSVTRAFENLAAKACIKVIRFHDCRHTHASLMLKQGIHPKVVQERLGHSTISVTLDTYSHVAPGLQEAAAKRFDEITQVRIPDQAPVILD